MTCLTVVEVEVRSPNKQISCLKLETNDAAYTDLCDRQLESQVVYRLASCVGYSTLYSYLRITRSRNAKRGLDGAICYYNIGRLVR